VSTTGLSLQVTFNYPTHMEVTKTVLLSL
jgi:hypothetical protein